MEKLVEYYKEVNKDAEYGKWEVDQVLTSSLLLFSSLSLSSMHCCCQWLMINDHWSSRMEVWKVGSWSGFVFIVVVLITVIVITIRKSSWGDEDDKRCCQKFVLSRWIDDKESFDENVFTLLQFDVSDINWLLFKQVILSNAILRPDRQLCSLPMENPLWSR